MLHVFEVHMAPGVDPDELLSPEVRRETGAQVMTLSEARALGFTGIEPHADRELRLVAVAPRDAQWVHRSLESNGTVTSYKVHEVDL